MIEVTPTILGIQGAVFLTGMGLVWKFLLGPFNKRLEDRRRTIAEQIENADKIRAEAQKIHGEYEKNLAELKARSAEVLTRAEKEAEVSRQEVVTAAHEQARSLLKKTEAELETEKKVLVEELRDEIGRLGVVMAEKILQKKFAREEHDRLVEEMSGELSK